MRTRHHSPLRTRAYFLGMPQSRPKGQPQKEAPTHYFNEAAFPIHNKRYIESCNSPNSLRFKRFCHFWTGVAHDLQKSEAAEW
jgi:hypothetical protein